MKKIIFLAALVVSAYAVQAHADTSVDFSNYNSCIVTYVKVQTDNTPNLVASCDGGAGYYAETVPYVKDLTGSYDNFKTVLRAYAEAVTNKSGTKTCDEVDTNQVWWLACHN